MSNIYCFSIADFTGISNVGISYDYVKLCQIIKGTFSFKLKVKHTPSGAEYSTFRVGVAGTSSDFLLGNFTSLSNVSLIAEDSNYYSDSDSTERSHIDSICIVREPNNNAYICVTRNFISRMGSEVSIVLCDFCTIGVTGSYIADIRDVVKGCTYNRYITESEISEVKYPSMNVQFPSIGMVNSTNACFLIAERVNAFVSKFYVILEQTYGGNDAVNTRLIECSVKITNKRATLVINGVTSTYINSKVELYYEEVATETYNVYLVLSNMRYNRVYLDNNIVPKWLGDSSTLPQSAIKFDTLYGMTENPGDYSSVMRSHDFGTQIVSTNNKKPYYWFGNWYDAEGEVINIRKKGTTAQRPTPEKVGFIYIDETLGNKPIFWTGDTSIGDNGWVDANGNNPSQT